MKQRGFAHIALLALLVAGLIAGLVLVQRAQVFKSKASQVKVEDIIIFRGNTFCDKNGQNCEAFRDRIDVLLISPLFEWSSPATPTVAPTVTPTSSPPEEPTPTADSPPSGDGSEDDQEGSVNGVSVLNTVAASHYRLWVTTAPDPTPQGDWQEYIQNSSGVTVKGVRLPNSAQAVYVSVQFKYRDRDGREKESNVYQRPIIYKSFSVINPTATPMPTLTPTAAPPTPTPASFLRSVLPKPTGLAKKCSSGGLVQLSWKPVAGFPNYWYKYWAKYTDDGKKAGEPAGRGNFASMTNFVYVKVGLDKEYSWKVMVGGANINERTGDMSTDAAESTFICHLRPD